MPAVEVLSAAAARGWLPQFDDLLIDVVHGGAAVGFLPPVTAEIARTYWQGVLAEVAQGSQVLLAATEGPRLLGSVQLALAMRSNGLHRAEVQKLMVHSGARRQGVGSRLMQAVEAAALAANRSLLVLDTREGDEGERLYRAAGFIEAGRIPNYARSADGSLHTTVLFYKMIG